MTTCAIAAYNCAEIMIVYHKQPSTIAVYLSHKGYGIKPMDVQQCTRTMNNMPFVHVLAQWHSV